MHPSVVKLKVITSILRSRDPLTDTPTLTRSTGPGEAFGLLGWPVRRQVWETRTSSIDSGWRNPSGVKVDAPHEKLTLISSLGGGGTSPEMTSTAKVGAQGPPLGQHQGNSSIRRTCRQLVMASFAFVGLFYAVVGSHLGQGDELKMFSGKINDVGATVGNDSGLFAGWASAPKVDIGASVVGIKTTWQKFGDDPSCNPVDWQEIVSAIDTGKSPPMNTTMTIVHTSKAVTSTYAPSASQLDPTGVMAAQGFTEDYSRPGAILVLLSDKFLHPVKPLNKLYASHMVKSLADNWYKKDLSRTKSVFPPRGKNHRKI